MHALCKQKLQSQQTPKSTKVGDDGANFSVLDDIDDDLSYSSTEVSTSKVTLKFQLIENRNFVWNLVEFRSKIFIRNHKNIEIFLCKSQFLEIITTSKLTMSEKSIRQFFFLEFRPQHTHKESWLNKRMRLRDSSSVDHIKARESLSSLLVVILKVGRFGFQDSEEDSHRTFIDIFKV